MEDVGVATTQGMGGGSRSSSIGAARYVRGQGKEKITDRPLL